MVAVVAESFAGLFYRNALNLGLTVVVCKDAAKIADGVRMSVDAAAGRIVADGVVLACEPIPTFLMEMLNAGGLLPHLKKKLQAAKSATGAA